MTDSPLQRVRNGAVALGVIVVLAIAGYRIWFGYDWVESIWMTTVTLSSVGYGERSAGSPAFQLFTIVLIVLGLSSVGYTFGGFIQLLTQGEIERAFGRKRMTKEIGRMKNHVIVCGYGRMAHVLIRDLVRAGKEFVVIEADPTQCGRLEEAGLRHVQGDATEETVLRSAGVMDASTVVCCVPNDAVNVFVTLTCRNLNPRLTIIARAEHASTEGKLRQAGADRTVLPAVVGGHQMSRMILKPTHADLLDLFSGSDHLDVDIDEITIADDSRLAGVRVQDTLADRRDVIVVAIRSADASIRFNPRGEDAFSAGDTVVLMGARKELDDYYQSLELPA